jgi:hypothetical protein
LPIIQSAIAGFACGHDPSHARTYFDRTEYPEDERLYHDEGGRTDTESKVDADIFANLRVAAIPLIDF